MFNINKIEFKKNKFLIIFLIFIVTISVTISIFFPSNNILDERSLSNKNIDIHKLVINEILSSNNGVYQSEDGSVCDFIEIYNGTTKDINLKNYGLSDQESKVKWTFPDITINKDSYLLINLCGEKKDGLYVPFKLKSSGGETISLTSSDGKVIDAVETALLENNKSMGRDDKGSWHTLSKITPGFSNNEVGYNKYIENLKGNNDDIKITEYLPKNDGNFIINGKFPDYVELTNLGENDINLKNYSLSNDISVPFKYNLPNIILKKNEVMVFYTNSTMSNKNVNLSFKLDSNSGTIILSKNGKIIENQSYNSLTNGIAKIRNNDNFYESSIISPGYLNDNKGIMNFNISLNTPSDLIINELVNNNTSYMPQNGGKFYDYIELKNNSNETINLSNYNISTKNVPMFKLPNKDLKSGEYYIIYASGDTNLSNDKYVHTNFKLSDTESVYLFKNDLIIDSVVISNIPINYSYGRGEYGFYYINSPTPLENNKSGIKDISSTPTVDTISGIYNNVDELKIAINALGTIYYTLDGSKPTVSSNVYNGPLSIKKTTVLKAISREENKIISNVITNTYIVNENHTLPVMSISLDKKNFNSIQANAWSNLEYEAYAELYEKNSSFKIPCGIELFGGSTRGLAKKSFLLKFKKKYGESKLTYKVFDTRDFQEFDSIILRSGSQDYKTAFIRDILATSLVDEYTDVDVQAYKPVILYINGKYWGIYNIREKVDETFVNNHYNINSDNSNIMRIDYDVTVGSSYGYRQLLNFVRNNDMTNNKNYEYFKSKVNVENMIDFWIAESYVTNNDIVNCRFFWNKDINNGKLHFIFYDLDYAWYNYKNNYYNFILDPNGMEEGFNLDTSFLRSVIKNKEFQEKFIERLNYNLNNTWKKENILNKIDELYNELAPEINRNQERWGLTRNKWDESIKYLKKYVNERQKYLLSTTKYQFNLTNNQMKEYFGDLYE